MATRLDMTVNAEQSINHLAPEHRLIVDLVEPGARVLDLGCGAGDLLKALQVEKQARAEGVELSETCIQACVAKGLFSVHHGDLDEGLAEYGDKSVDYVILTNTIQVLHRPLLLIREMARVGKKCIISFPNFGHWPIRAQLFFQGRMPKSRRLPYEWYDTPNIRLLTIHDFRAFCREVSLRVLQEIAISTSNERCKRVRLMPNLLADGAVFVVEEMTSADAVCPCLPARPR
jgi:methionine biosynthesis protein MetW